MKVEVTIGIPQGLALELISFLFFTGDLALTTQLT